MKSNAFEYLDHDLVTNQSCSALFAVVRLVPFFNYHVLSINGIYFLFIITYMLRG